MKHFRKIFVFTVTTLLLFSLIPPAARAGSGKSAYSNSIPYDRSSTLKTLEEIFHVTPLLGAAAYPETIDLSDLFKP
ncbi:MAG TPA: hypothetical protein VIW68_07860 [Candidatus Sulfotelmatobacter sp.]